VFLQLIISELTLKYNTFTPSGPCTKIVVSFHVQLIKKIAKACMDHSWSGDSFLHDHFKYEAL